jgi:hypothetical protein
MTNQINDYGYVEPINAIKKNSLPYIQYGASSYRQAVNTQYVWIGGTNWFGWAIRLTGAADYFVVKLKALRNIKNLSVDLILFTTTAGTNNKSFDRYVQSVAQSLAYNLLTWNILNASPSGNISMTQNIKYTHTISLGDIPKDNLITLYLTNGNANDIYLDTFNWRYEN